MTSPLDQDLQVFAHRLADEGRRISLEFFRTRYDVTRKEDGTPVTDADLAIENALRQMIEQHYPAHGVFGEENDACRSDAEWLWVIDPIDGTKSFATGKPTFGCLIALLHHRQPVLGIIDMPALKERWLGMVERPTRLNEQLCRTSSTHELSAATLNATTPDMFNPEEWATFSSLGEAVRFRQFGADCYAYGLLASGFTDLVMEAGLGKYDYLALVPVIEGAGGCISDWQGQPLTFDSGSQVLASANARLHENTLRMIESLT
jgi:inositol-phosphate phosphatase/L-galactose 1-phosphate phosphatase/histidinol-phosphatase